MSPIIGFKGQIMTFAIRLGQRLKQVRRLGGMSQDQAAELAGISGKYLGEIERGEANATVIVLAKLADALQIELPELLSFGHVDTRENLIKKINALIEGIPDEELAKIYRAIVAIIK